MKEQPARGTLPLASSNRTIPKDHMSAHSTAFTSSSIYFVVLVSCRPYVSGCMAEATRAAEIKVVVRSYSQGWCQHDVCLWQVIA